MLSFAFSEATLALLEEDDTRELAIFLELILLRADDSALNFSL
jgi:hypothetical protein